MTLNTDVTTDDAPESRDGIPEGFVLEHDGLYWSVERQRVSGAFEVLGRSRNERGTGWGTRVAFNDDGGLRHEVLVEDASLVSSTAAAIAAPLADCGMQVVSPQKLRQFFIEVRPTRRLLEVGASGWHRVSGRYVYV